MSNYAIAAAFGAAILLSAISAQAHATLETTEAKVKSGYKGVIRIGHGCEGSPTLIVRVRIPEGVISVKPQPKSGWTVETVKAPYQSAHDYYGTSLTEGVREIVWTGKLLDEHYDEFVFRGYISGELQAGQTVWFPVVQECEKGAHRWIEIPVDGKSADDYEEPAPGVKLLPASGGH
jgi:uncharacterized protein YcnI